MPFLREVLEDKDEDSMCRHEAAEAIGALGDEGSLELLRKMRDDGEEVVVVRETCEIAVARIEWEGSEQRKLEKLKQRYVLRLSHVYGVYVLQKANVVCVVISHLWIRHQLQRMSL